MAEFCLDCWNKINKSKDDEKKYILSKDLDLCEGCGEWKHVVIRKRKGIMKSLFTIVIILLCIIAIIMMPSIDWVESFLQN